MNSMRAYLKPLLSLALLLALACQIDCKNLITLCKKAQYSWLVGGLCCFLLLMIPHLLRWRLILKRLNILCAYPKLLSLLWIGYFFNQIMPTAIGGDAARLWYLQKEGHAWQTVLNSLILDRGYALIGLCLLYFVLALGLPLFNGPLIYQHALYLCIGLFSIFSMLVCAAKYKFVVSCLEWPPLRWSLPIWRDWQRVATLKSILPLLSLSTVNHLLNGFAFVAITQAFHVPLALGVVFLIFLLMLLVSMLPFSFAGWGVREGALIWLFAQYGIAAEQAFAVSILYGVLQLGIGLMGGIIWFRRGVRVFLPHWSTQTSIS